MEYVWGFKDGLPKGAAALVGIAVTGDPRRPLPVDASAATRAIVLFGAVALGLGALGLSGVSLLLAFIETSMAEFEGVEVDGERILVMLVPALLYSGLVAVSARTLWLARTGTRRSDGLGTATMIVVGIGNPVLLGLAWLGVGVAAYLSTETLVQATVLVLVGELGIVVHFWKRLTPDHRVRELPE